MPWTPRPRGRTRSGWYEEVLDGPWPNQTTPVSRGETGQDAPRATLWLPDPESYSGWGIRHVWAESESPQQRTVGFARRED